MKQHTRLVMVDENAYLEAAAKLLHEYEQAEHKEGTALDEIAAVKYIMYTTFAKHAAMLFRGND